MNANQFFDDCEVYFELPMGGKMEDATELLSGFDTEVRLAACAFAEAYAEGECQRLREALRDLHKFTKDFSGPRIDKLNKKAESLLGASPEL
jgi:hypothetical protein